MLPASAKAAVDAAGAGAVQSKALASAAEKSVASAKNAVKTAALADPDYADKVAALGSVRVEVYIHGIDS